MIYTDYIEIHKEHTRTQRETYKYTRNTHAHRENTHYCTQHTSHLTYIRTHNFKYIKIIQSKKYTPSISRKMTHFLGNTRFYATLFCVLSGDKCVSIFYNGSFWLGQIKKKSGSFSIGWIKNIAKKYCQC